MTRVDKAMLRRCVANTGVAGDELRCPHCRVWHTVIRRHAEGTDCTRAMRIGNAAAATSTPGRSVLPVGI